MQRPDRKVVLKYALVQIPGIAAAALVAAALHHWLGLPRFVGVAGVLLWVLKDIAMFFVTWRSYAGGGGTGSSMTGLEGEALERLAPSGRISVRGENWAARVKDEADCIEKGAPVRVEAMDGLTLVVSEGRPGKSPT